MPMMQADIQEYYRKHWEKVGENRSGQGDAALAYSSPIEDAAIYPIYEKLIRENGIKVDGGDVLDIGTGAGRWIRFFLERFAPATITGADFAQASITMLQEWSAALDVATRFDFQATDITSPSCSIEGRFDLVNVGNVLFHIPETDKFEQALVNIAGLLAEGGSVVTTEYLPKNTMRTEWMLVRSRNEFQAACQHAGLEIVDIRACSFFSNDPMGVDGSDDGLRKQFNTVRALTNQLLENIADEQPREFVTKIFSEIELACLGFCREHMRPIDMPAQKLVVLRAR